MLPTDIAESLVEIREASRLAATNSDWKFISESLEKDLKEAAQQNGDFVQYSVMNKPNVSKLVQIIKDVPGLTVETQETQRNGTRVTISF